MKYEDATLQHLVDALKHAQDNVDNFVDGFWYYTLNHTEEGYYLVQQFNNAASMIIYMEDNERAVCTYTNNNRDDFSEQLVYYTDNIASISVARYREAIVRYINYKHSQA